MFYNLGARALFMAWTRLTDLGFIYINPQGCQGQGKSSGKGKNFQVREKSGNYIFSQGNLKKMKKVMQKSGNFKIFLKRC